MNAEYRYERHEPRAEPSHTSGAEDAERSKLAVHGDPSRTQQKTTLRPTRSVQWVRPSDLPAMVGSRYVRFGIDANSELARATRRAPRQAISRVRNRVSRRGIATPELPPTHTTPNTREGIGL
ncbi:hypothetical protein NBCG_01590 [Nocardioidaceae bacterium Broad-1]|nr:hypothetical protein NBCG_01590 [Nocardioidaceae bacterium Broad-1]